MAIECGVFNRAIAQNDGILMVAKVREFSGKGKSLVVFGGFQKGNKLVNLFNFHEKRIPQKARKIAHREKITRGSGHAWGKKLRF